MRHDQEHAARTEAGDHMPRINAVPVTGPATGPVTLAAYLSDRDEACPSCGYNLRGLASDRCPECMTELVLRVAMAEPRLGLFLSTVVAWSLGAGFSALLLVYLLVVMVMTPRSLPPMEEFMVTPVGGTLLEGGAVVLLIVHQRRVRRWPLTKRVALLVAGVVCTLANVCVFAWLVR